MPRGAIPEYPPILRGTVEEQMIQLREYIIRNIEAMQRDLTASGGTIYVDNGVAYVTINGSTMTLQEFIQNYVNSDGNTINITVNANIESNPDLQEKTFNVTENGDFSVLPDADKDGLSKVNLHVTVPADGPSGTIQITENGTVDVTDYANASVNVQPDLQTKSITIAENGTQTVMPDTGKDGLTSVEITVNVPQGITPSGTINITNNGTHDVTNYASANVQVPSAAPNLQSKNATPSGSAQTIVPDSEYDGLSSVIIAAAPLETKSVTPTASQQIITPSSGQYGMSQVTVEGDADLIAGNIKKDIVIFGVTGTYEGSGGSAVNGSLIYIDCSSNIDEVTATVNGNTYTAYLDTSTHKAYVTIPRTDTITTQTCVLRGYNSGSEVTSANLTMSGIAYYTATLSTSSLVYNNGVWTGVDTHSWQDLGGTPATMTEQPSNLLFTVTEHGSQGYDHGQGGIALTPAISMRGYTAIEIKVSLLGGIDGPWFCADDTAPAYMVPDNIRTRGIKLSDWTSVFQIPSEDQGKMLYLYFGGYAEYGAGAVNCAAITRIRFV